MKDENFILLPSAFILRLAPVAQLDRASVFGTECWGFEPLRARCYIPSGQSVPLTGSR